MYLFVVLGLSAGRTGRASVPAQHTPVLQSVGSGQSPPLCSWY